MTQSTNPHLTDPVLAPFLSPTFTPTAYLNTHLPTLPPQPQSSHPTPHAPPKPNLTALASQTQSQITTLNTHLNRLSETLTTLTDEILRTSSRLAYEVELLRGEAVALAATLSSDEGLKGAIERFVPGGLLKEEGAGAALNGQEAGNEEEKEGISEKHPAVTVAALEPTEPPALTKLKLLHKVRSQLQSVIRAFNLALLYPLPPSALTTGTSLVSVAPPSNPEAESKAQVGLKKLETELRDQMASGDVEGAQKRVKELRDVLPIWSGTIEEKARGRWVEGLEGLVRVRGKEGVVVGTTGGKKEGGVGKVGRGEVPSRSSTPAQSSGGGGFLRRLRDEIYLD